MCVMYRGFINKTNERKELKYKKEEKRLGGR